VQADVLFGTGRKQGHSMMLAVLSKYKYTADDFLTQIMPV
jgi:hypothetical protein